MGDVRARQAAASVVMGDSRRDIRMTMTASAPMHTSFSKLLDEIGTVDQVGIEERVAKFQTRSIKKSSKLWGLKTAVSMVDLTTLEGKDTPGKVASLCQKARQPSFDPDVPPVAAVCIYPFLVRHAARWLADTAIKVASVATAFPSGQSPLALRLEEVKTAVSDGADEIDMAINRGLLLAGEFNRVQDERRAGSDGAKQIDMVSSRGLFLAGEFNADKDEISAVIDACGDGIGKVILEA